MCASFAVCFVCCYQSVDATTQHILISEHPHHRLTLLLCLAFLAPSSSNSAVASAASRSVPKCSFPALEGNSFAVT